MSNDAIERIEQDGFVGEIHYDEDPMSPVDAMDQLGTLVTWHRRSCWQEDGEKVFGTPNDFMERAKREGWVWVNVGLIDHSGQSFYLISEDTRKRTQRRGDDAHPMDPGGWDSGQVGFLYTTKDRFKEVMDTNLHRWRVRAKEALESELETWDEYARGAVYGYVVKAPGGEVIESCWGFYGDESVKAEMKAAMDHAVKAAKDAERMERETFAL